MKPWMALFSVSLGETLLFAAFPQGWIFSNVSLTKVLKKGFPALFQLGSSRSEFATASEHQ